MVPKYQLVTGNSLRNAKEGFKPWGWPYKSGGIYLQTEVPYAISI